jgi:hypothetical protein
MYIITNTVKNIDEIIISAISRLTLISDLKVRYPMRMFIFLLTEQTSALKNPRYLIQNGIHIKLMALDYDMKLVLIFTTGILFGLMVDFLVENTLILKLLEITISISSNNQSWRTDYSR